jgi:hypothetical protein
VKIQARLTTGGTKRQTAKQEIGFEPLDNWFSPVEDVPVVQAIRNRPA